MPVKVIGILVLLVRGINIVTLCGTILSKGAYLPYRKSLSA
jgi:hypothetical protein